MKAIAALATLVLIISASAFADDTPHWLAGLRLGGQVQEFKDLVRMETILPLRFSPFIHEVETVEIPGYKYGLLWLGNCEEPGRIVRIKMKYADSSQKFYQKLLKRLKERFGEPDEWRGDPFHIVVAWKWSFMDEQGNDISMILEHNTRDEAETMGNSLKLTMWNLVHKEQRCYQQKYPENTEKEKPPQVPPDWNLLIPR